MTNVYDHTCQTIFQRFISHYFQSFVNKLSQFSTADQPHELEISSTKMASKSTQRKLKVPQLRVEMSLLSGAHIKL